MKNRVREVPRGTSQPQRGTLSAAVSPPSLSARRARLDVLPSGAAVASGQAAQGFAEQNLFREADRVKVAVAFSERLLLRPAEVAALIGTSRSTAYELIAAGTWRIVRMGNRGIRVLRRDLERWVEEQAGSAGEGQA